VDAARQPVQIYETPRDLLIAFPPLRRLAIPPCVVPAGGDLQHAALRGDGPDRLMRSHEFEDPDGIEPVSRANQAAAFDKISRSVFSCFTSRRSRPSSSRSAVVRPSARRPSSRSAWRTQLRIAWLDGSNSFASSSGDRPE